MRCNSIGVGCKACEWWSTERGETLSCPYSRFEVTCLKLGNIRRHAASQTHQRALKAYKDHLLGLTSDAVGAPSVKEFESIWHALAKSSTGSVSEAVQMSKRKATSMEWCIWEALRDSERDALASASTISLGVDERNGRLCGRTRLALGRVWM